jgi:hypothetical protein
MPKEMCIEKRPKGKKTAFSLSGTDVTDDSANPQADNGNFFQFYSTHFMSKQICAVYPAMYAARFERQVLLASKSFSIV